MPDICDLRRRQQHWAVQRGQLHEREYILIAWVRFARIVAYDCTELQLLRERRRLHEHGLRRCCCPDIQCCTGQRLSNAGSYMSTGRQLSELA